MRQMGWGENCELWIGHKLQACASGGDFVEAARKGTLEHDYDIVKGPKMSNPSAVSDNIEKPEVLNKGTQIAITSEKAAKLIKCID